MYTVVCYYSLSYVKDLSGRILTAHHHTGGSFHECIISLRQTPSCPYAFNQLNFGPHSNKAKTTNKWFTSAHTLVLHDSPAVNENKWRVSKYMKIPWHWHCGCFGWVNVPSILVNFSAPKCSNASTSPWYDTGIALVTGTHIPTWCIWSFLMQGEKDT